jgi:hypothetical protein
MSESDHGRRFGTAPTCFRSASVTGPSGGGTDGLLSATSGHSVDLPDTAKLVTDPPDGDLQFE